MDLSSKDKSRLRKQILKIIKTLVVVKPELGVRAHRGRHGDEKQTKEGT